MKDWKRKTGRALRKIALALLSAAVLAALYFSLVIAQPQPEEGKEAAPAPQPLLTASPSQTVQSEGEIRAMAELFPGPVMSFMSGSGMIFVSGTSADRAFQGGFGREMTLYWQTEDGQPLTLRSIYPAEALELMGKQDYRFSATAGPTLFGESTVRMENGETVRIHTQILGKGLYVLTVSASLSDRISAISRSIQLLDP